MIHSSFIDHLLCAWHSFNSSILENEEYEKFPIFHYKNNVIGVCYQRTYFICLELKEEHPFFLFLLFFV